MVAESSADRLASVAMARARSMVRLELMLFSRPVARRVSDEMALATVATLAAKELSTETARICSAVSAAVARALSCDKLVDKLASTLDALICSNRILAPSEASAAMARKRAAAAVAEMLLSTAMARVCSAAVVVCSSCVIVSTRELVELTVRYRLLICDE